jgi:uncharacterized membrane protein (DUF485 family)
MGDFVEDGYGHEHFRAPAKTPERKSLMNDWVARFIAVLTVSFFFFYVGLITYLSFLTTGHVDLALVNLVIGWIGGLASAIIMYYFGSSMGSNAKSEMMANMRPPSAPEAPTPPGT